MDVVVEHFSNNDNQGMTAENLYVSDSNYPDRVEVDQYIIKLSQ